MKFTIITLLSLICFYAHALPNSEGPWTSGGGNALVYPDGTLRFLDITPKNEYPTVAPSKKVLEKIYAGPRNLKKLYDKFDNFHSMFSDVVSNWREYSPTLIDDMIFRIKYVDANFVLFNTYKAILKGDHSRLAVSSPSAKQSIQVLTALYQASRISFDKRIFDKLASDQDRLAVVVHEGLRQYLYSLNQDWRNVSTSELEEAVNILVTQKPSSSAARRLEAILKHDNTDYTKLINDGRLLIDQLSFSSAFDHNEIKQLLTMVTKFNQEVSLIKHLDCDNKDLCDVVQEVFMEFNTQYDSLIETTRKNQALFSILKNELSKSQDAFWLSVANSFDKNTNLYNQISGQLKEGLISISDIKLRWGYCFDANTLKVVSCLK